MSFARALLLGPVGSGIIDSLREDAKKDQKVVGGSTSDPQVEQMAATLIVTIAVLMAFSAVLWGVLLYNVAGKNNKLSVVQNVWLLGVAMTFGPFWTLVVYLIWNQKPGGKK